MKQIMRMAAVKKETIKKYNRKKKYKDKLKKVKCNICEEYNTSRRNKRTKKKQIEKRSEYVLSNKVTEDGVKSKRKENTT